MADSLLQGLGNTQSSLNSAVPLTAINPLSALPVVANLSLSLVELDTTAGLTVGEQFQVQAKFIDIRNPSVFQSVFGGYGVPLLR